MLYELTTLACSLLSTGDVVAGALTWTAQPAARGTVLGCWRTEIGTLGRVLVLRAFETADMLAAERQRALDADAPFATNRLATSLTMESFAAFPFLPPPRIGARGPIYEFRTYRLKPGGLPPTLAGWQAAIAPAAAYTAHLVINLYALDGPPRITHIWAFADLAERMERRRAAYAAGVWPPKGGPEQIIEATSTIALPEPGSPLS